MKNAGRIVIFVCAWASFQNCFAMQQKNQNEKLPGINNIIRNCIKDDDELLHNKIAHTAAQISIVVTNQNKTKSVMIREIKLLISSLKENIEERIYQWGKMANIEKTEALKDKILKLRWLANNIFVICIKVKYNALCELVNTAIEQIKSIHDDENKNEVVAINEINQLTNFMKDKIKKDLSLWLKLMNVDGEAYKAFLEKENRLINDFQKRVDKFFEPTVVGIIIMPPNF